MTRTRHDYTLATADVALSTYVATSCIRHLTNSTHHLDTRFSLSNFERPVLGHIKSAVSKPILAIKYLMGNSLGRMVNLPLKQPSLLFLSSRDLSFQHYIFADFRWFMFCSPIETSSIEMPSKFSATIHKNEKSI